MLRCKQATAAPKLLSSGTESIGCKTQRAIEIAEEAALCGRKTIIFSLFEKVARLTAEQLTHLGAVLYTGKQNEREREAAKKAFMENPEVKVLAGTIGTMGAGLTLTSSSVIVFVDLPWCQTDKDQAEDRVHRIGQSQTVTVYTLAVKGTKDRQILNILVTKKAISEFTLDGSVSHSDNYSNIA
jgi:SNF2 family DNA or RNA helicase